MVECKITGINGQSGLYSFSIYSGLIYVCTGVCSKIVETTFEGAGEIVYSIQRKNHLGIYESLISCTGRTVITLGEGVSEDVIEKATRKTAVAAVDKVIE